MVSGSVFQTWLKVFKTRKGHGVLPRVRGQRSGAPCRDERGRLQHFSLCSQDTVCPLSTQAQYKLPHLDQRTCPLPQTNHLDMLQNNPSFGVSIFSVHTSPGQRSANVMKPLMLMKLLRFKTKAPGDPELPVYVNVPVLELMESQLISGAQPSSNLDQALPVRMGFSTSPVWKRRLLDL